MKEKCGKARTKKETGCLTHKRGKGNNADTWTWIARKPEVIKETANEERQLTGYQNIPNKDTIFN